MRIARTTGVSDAPVKPRRGISLREVREVPKPAPPLKKPPLDLDKLTQGARNGLDNFAQAFADPLSPTVRPSRIGTIQFRTEEVPEDRRFRRYAARDLDLRNFGFSTMREMADQMAGAVPDGDIGALEFTVPYETLEDIHPTVMRNSLARFDTMPISFWLYIADRLGAGDVSGYTRVETHRNVQNHTISVRFTTR